MGRSFKRGHKVKGYDQARKIAELLIGQVIRPEFGDVVIMNARTLESKQYWVFYYNSREFVHTGSHLDALIGNAPVIVSKRTGRAWVGETGVPIEDQLSSD